MYIYSTLLDLCMNPTLLSLDGQKINKNVKDCCLYLGLPASYITPLFLPPPVIDK